MIAQLDSKIISSFLLHLDHEIQDKGQAYQNVVTQFYPVTHPYYGTFAFTCPYKSLCNDISITGANILSGVYLGGQYIQVGQSGLRSINHYKGAIYFTGTNPTSIISGSMAVKEVNIKLTDKPDWKLLFETQYVSNDSRLTPSGTGIALDAEVSPIVFLRFKGQENKPFGFSKLDNQSISMRAIVVADNEFQKISLTSIFKNMNFHTIPIVTSTPFTSMGEMTGLNYDYRQLSFDNSFTPIILSVKVIDVPQQGYFKDIVRNMAFVDFEISTICRS